MIQAEEGEEKLKIIGMKNFMENSKYLITGVLLFCLLSCTKPPRNYYPDQDDPGLSRLTDYGYNIATNYLNGVAYINPYSGNSGNIVPTLTRIAGNTNDTLALAWPIEQNVDYPLDASYIDLLIPIPKNFTLNDLAAMNGKRFANNTNAISLSPRYYYDPVYGYTQSSGTGSANIYFVSISIRSEGISMTGLFNGSIGTDTLITDGRFDFYMPYSYVHL
jgi:hypothetical protein